MHHAAEKSHRCCHIRGQRGYSLTEVIATAALFGIITSIGVSNFSPRQMRIVEAHRLVIAQLRLARTSAITKSTHYSVAFESSTALRVSPMRLVGTEWQVDTTASQLLALPSDTQLSSAAVGTTVEFNSRGEAVNLDEPVHIDISDSYGVTKVLDVWPSGQVNAS